MDKMVDAVTEYLCRHRSVGLFRLTLDLMRHRLDLFAEIGAVEVAMGAVAPPTPGTDAWWRAVAAVREAVYTLRERGLVQSRPRWSTGSARLVDSPTSTRRPAASRSRIAPKPAKPPRRPGATCSSLFYETPQYILNGVEYISGFSRYLSYVR
jgi:hypothetical protein